MQQLLEALKRFETQEPTFENLGEFVYNYDFSKLKYKDLIPKAENENDYVFPVLKKNLSELQKHKDKDQFIKTINKYMKLIGQDIGYDKPLTTYAARHSFATVLKRSGTPMEFISESLGHKSLHTTEAYLDSFEDQTRRKFMENLIPK